MINIKKVVQYKRSPFNLIKVGSGATVYPINHPSHKVTNETLVYTSTVLAYDKVTGKFETINTIYELGD
jgi:hypothetical protein